MQHGTTLQHTKWQRMVAVPFSSQRAKDAYLGRFENYIVNLVRDKE